MRVSGVASKHAGIIGASAWQTRTCATRTRRIDKILGSTLVGGLAGGGAKSEVGGAGEVRRTFGVAIASLTEFFWFFAVVARGEKKRE